MKNPFDISGRVALVIGGTSGIGREVAIGLAEAGVHTVAAGRRPNEPLVEELRSRGIRTVPAVCDVTDKSTIDRLKELVLTELGSVDILVNSAGRTFRKPTNDVSETDWSNLIDTNLTGMLRSCQSFYEPLKKSGRGRIVNIASLSSFVAFHEVAAYSASKAAVMSLTQSLGAEWAKDGIRTNALVPGVFVTDLNRDLLNGTERGRELLMRSPFGRFGELTELVGAALFLCSDAVSFITGTSLVVDGGFLASGVNR